MRKTTRILNHATGLRDIWNLLNTNHQCLPLGHDGFITSARGGDDLVWMWQRTELPIPYQLQFVFQVTCLEDMILNKEIHFTYYCLQKPLYTELREMVIKLQQIIHIYIYTYICTQCDGIWWKNSCSYKPDFIHSRTLPAGWGGNASQRWW
jgi:hypothetical protein